MSKPRGISASRGAAVLGLSEFQTPLEVWQRITEEREPGFNARNGYEMPPEPNSAAIRWGTAFEDAVIELAERERGKKIFDREGLYTKIDLGLHNKPSDGFITCHIDGRYDCGEYECPNGFTLHEGKTTSIMAYREKWGEPGTDCIPRVYQIQVQHQMLCTGAREVIVSVLVFPETPDKWEKDGWEVREIDEGEYALIHSIDNKNGSITQHFVEIKKWASVLCEMGYFHQYTVKANPAVQEMLVKHYTDFWNNHVLTGKPPEPRNYEDIKRLLTEPVGTIICDTQMTAWFLEYKSINKEIGKTGNAQKRKDKLRLRIMDKTRKLNAVIDDESQEKIIYRDTQGNKLGQYSKAGGFR